jgi:5'-deoxynucleotidase YfbR-like HD superfamily hydrolase
MLSGRRLDLLNPSPLDVEIEDIAHGLSRMARWNGQTKGAHIFSVAQHSVLVEHIACHIQPDLDAQSRLIVLLHDAPEYVIGDIISPFKAAVGETYKTIENRLLEAIHIRFGLPAKPSPALSRLTKKADRAAAYLEAIHLAGFQKEEAEKFFGSPLPLSKATLSYLEPVQANEAKQVFMDAFKAINRLI